MNILLINHYVGSPDLGMEYRPYYLAREWIRDGHDVTILGGSFSHIRTNQPVITSGFEKQEIDGIRYIWIKTPVYKGNGLSRFISMLAFVFKIIIKAKAISKKYKPDVVIASSTYPLDNYPARSIARKSNAKYIYEVHDLWPLSPMELGGMSKYHPFIMIMQKAENYAYKHANHVVSLLPNALDYMTSHGMAARKFNYIPNGVNLKEWSLDDNIPEKHLALLEKLRMENKKIIGYIGGHAVSNALNVFIDAIKLMQNNNVCFVLVGSGVEKERLIKRAKKLELNNVYFLPPVAKRSVPKLLSLMDVLYIGWNKKPLYRFGISPNKLLDYMMAGKPIVHSVNAGNDIVKESKCGICVEAENPGEIAKGISRLLNLSDKERENMGMSGKSFVIKNHNYEILAKKIINIFQD